MHKIWSSSSSHKRMMMPCVSSTFCTFKSWQKSNCRILKKIVAFTFVLIVCLFYERRSTNQLVARARTFCLISLGWEPSHKSRDRSIFVNKRLSRSRAVDSETSNLQSYNLKWLVTKLAWLFRCDRLFNKCQCSKLKYQSSCLKKQIFEMSGKS